MRPAITEARRPAPQNPFATARVTEGDRPKSQAGGETIISTNAPARVPLRHHVARRGLRRFIRSAASSGIVLFGAAVLALGVANSPLAPAYFDVLHLEVGRLSVLHWVNDGLMALFFLLVGLEIKRELLIGQLAKWRRRILPGAAAVAGMVVPALIYVAVNSGSPGQLRGWAIPAATDIAFALGVLALLGSRVPVSLKVLLTAIAVIDDLLAIIVIAFFYSDGIALGPLALAVAGLALLIAFNRLGVRALLPYLALGPVIWWGVLQSGVHATLAGVALAFAIPLHLGERRPYPICFDSPLHRLEHGLQPWVSFLIVPLFAFANAGLSGSDLGAPLPLGITLGLFVGKQVGIVGAIWALVRLGLAHMPAHATWRQIWGMAALCGIGFTMSLFIGGLAFPRNEEAIEAVKLGVLFGSILSGFVGWMILAKSLPEKRAEIDRAHGNHSGTMPVPGSGP